MGFDAINTETREGKIYQASMFSLITVLPVFAFVHFWRLFNSARLITTKNPPQDNKRSALVSLDDPTRICTNYNARPEISCEGNITILPGLEPWLFAVVTAVAVAALLAQWWAVFVPGATAPARQPRSRANSHPDLIAPESLTEGAGNGRCGTRSPVCLFFGIIR